MVDPGIVEDQTNCGGGGGDAENRGENDDAPVPEPAPSPTTLPFNLQHHQISSHYSATSNSDKLIKAIQRMLRQRDPG